MEVILRQIGRIRLIVASTFDAAVQNIAELRPLLVVVNLHLPGFRGVADLRRLIAQPALGSAPALAVSTARESGLEDPVLAAGAQRFFSSADGCHQVFDHSCRAGRCRDHTAYSLP